MTNKKKPGAKKAARKIKSSSPSEKPSVRAKRAAVKGASDRRPVDVKSGVLPPHGAREAEMSGQVRASFEPPPPPNHRSPQVPFSPAPPPAEEGYELPERYGVTRLVLLVRDPHWIFAYWELNPLDVEKGTRLLGAGHKDCRLVLRLHFASKGEKLDASPYYDTEIDCEVGSWYLNPNRPNHFFLAEIGLRLGDRFMVLARSNVVCTPRVGISEVIDEKWLIPPELLERLYRLAIGLRSGIASEELAGVIKQRLEEELSSGALPSSPVIKKALRKGFFLWCNTELILYGGTEPDATLTVSGAKVGLRPDGTFSLRFALPDGLKDLKVKAVKADRSEERQIDIDVKKRTRKRK